MKIHFTTPTALDLKMLTVLGVSVKEQENSIGKFGTGLKYALAVLAREDIEVSIWIDGEQWKLNTVLDDFRDKEFAVVCLGETRLPFCTNYGMNWSIEDAYRELASNTIDEQGSIFVMDDSEKQVNYKGFVGTAFEIDSEEMCVVHQNSNILLDKETLHSEFESDYVTLYTNEINGKGSKDIYFQGIKASDFGDDAKAMFLYNFHSGVSLSEDRKISSQWDIEYWIKKTILQDIKDPTLLRQILEENDTEEFIEHSFNYNMTGTPSEAFLNVAFDLYAKRRLEECFRKVIKSSSSSSALSRASESLSGYYLSRITKYIEFLRVDLLVNELAEPFDIRVSDAVAVNRSGYIINSEDRIIMYSRNVVENFDDKSKKVILRSLLTLINQSDLFMDRFIEDNEDAAASFSDPDHWSQYIAENDTIVQPFKPKDVEEAA